MFIQRHKAGCWQKNLLEHVSEMLLWTAKFRRTCVYLVQTITSEKSAIPGFYIFSEWF